MNAIYRDLADALSQHMLGHDADPLSTLQERFKIDYLVELAEDYGVGDISLQELIQAYAGTGFDITLWINEMVNAGHFALDTQHAS